MFAFSLTAGAIGSIIRGHPEGAFALGLAFLTLLQAAVALGRTRQVVGLPLVWGLIVLAGFLVNPVADATTLPDLQAQLTSFEMLTALCVIQLVMAGLSLWLGLGLDGSRPGGTRPTLLLILHVLPAPMVVVAMLLIERTLLAETVGANPEAGGLQVGISIATLLILMTMAAMKFLTRRMFIPHILFSFTLILACMLVPGLQDPLPATHSQIQVESLTRLGAVLLGAAVPVAIGWWRACALIRPDDQS